MRNITAYLVGALIAGCGAGVSSDPTSDPTENPTENPTDDPMIVETPLATEPTLLLANVLATQAIASDAQNDGIYVAIVENGNTHDARLIRQDVRNGETTELDHMPMGKGTAQLLLGQDGIFWGFGGNGSELVTFRFVGTGGATDIAIADQGPTSLITQDYEKRLFYTSTHDCAIQALDLTTGQLDSRFRTGFSCFMTIESLVQTHDAAFIRASDDPGYSIRGYYKNLIAGFQLLDQSDADFTGPFTSTVEPVPGAAPTQHGVWSRTDGDGKSHIMSMTTNPWSLQPNPGSELRVIDGAVDAGTMVHDEFWGATLGDPTIIFHITKTEVRRHPMDYQPRAMFSLHNRLIVLTTDGTLLEQPIGADD